MMGLMLAVNVQAQTIDDISFEDRGGVGVWRVRFNAAVSLLQTPASGEVTRFTVRFEMLSADDSVLRQTTDETRRLPPQAGLPGTSLLYTAAPGVRVKQLNLEFDSPARLLVRQGTNSRTIELLLRPATAAVPTTAPSPPPSLSTAPDRPELAPDGLLADAATEAKATELMAAAQATRGEAAALLYDELLKLPPNSKTLPAQALIGEAWEQAGRRERAILEYKLYLRLYPQTPAAARVEQRLAALGEIASPTSPVAGGAPTVQSPAPTPARNFTGSLAQYYYGGKARSKSLVNIANGIDQATLSRTTESAIVTSADMTGRWADNDQELRAVVRGSATSNLLSTSHSSNALSALYLDYRRAGGEGLELRVGRQSPISGGLLGLFDGVSATYPVGQGLKVDLMGGVPANILITAPQERLVAAVVEADNLADRWGGNLYLLQQTTQSIANRRSLGGEVRYAGDSFSMNSLLDYDVLFRALNAVSVHTTMQAPGQTSLTFLVDSRRAPSLQLTNALISAGAASLRDLLVARSLEQVRADALATSATAKQFLMSVSRPMAERWQASLDLRYSAVGALPAVGDFAATPATGGQYTLNAQVTGTNLYSERDVNTFNLAAISTPFFHGWQVAYNNLSRLPVEADATIEPSLRLYVQTDKQSIKLLRVGPGLRTTYRASRRVSLLGEFLIEKSKTSGPGNHDDTLSTFFYLGYRYELF